jgi:hypothetical protein
MADSEAQLPVLKQLIGRAGVVHLSFALSLAMIAGAFSSTIGDFSCQLSKALRRKKT